MPPSLNIRNKNYSPSSYWSFGQRNILQRVANGAITDRANQNFLSRRALAYRISLRKITENAVQLV
jgi:hypothetical protein